MDFSQSAGGGGSGPTARSAAVAWGTSAYLQFSKDLSKFHVVKLKRVHYALTRLGFGLSCITFADGCCALL